MWRSAWNHGRATSLAKAIRQMNAHRMGCLLVPDQDGRAESIISFRDVVRYLKQNFN